MATTLVFKRLGNRLVDFRGVVFGEKWPYVRDKVGFNTVKTGAKAERSIEVILLGGNPSRQIANRYC
jgi:hypothetical protein